ncbi:hypothetical protein HYS50_03450 [Candidatus Woesearchaeota archaeon]|nr:hypothetical protein [Candidatus Woesearchaeota archaeon]
MNDDTVVTPFSLDEYLEISRALELHASIFFKLWDMGKPVFSNAILTSAVMLDKENNLLNFAVNKDFWNTLLKYEKSFVIAHECLHVLLKHGTRGASLEQKMISNVAMDIAINHILVSGFNFDITKLSPGLVQKLCWVDTIFPPEKAVDIPTNKAFEYYYNLLIEELSGGDGGENWTSPFGPIDDLGGLEEIEKWLEENKSDLGVAKEDVQEIKKKITDGKNKQPQKQQQQGKKNGLAAGTESSFEWLPMPQEKPPTKSKWEKLFKEFNKRMHGDDDKEQWARPSRRFAALSNDSLMLPTENEEEHYKKEKIEVYLFLDVSGSCRHLGPRFFRAARSISKKYFDIHLCVFSTWVEEISFRNSNLKVGHGTSFSCIERYLRQQSKPYPKYVMVFTDGAGDRVFPKAPNAWHWFLSEITNDHCIPSESKKYKLSDYE